MLRHRVLIAGLLALGVSQAVQAEEHDVLMFGRGYFPNFVAAQPGDTIRFTNMNSMPTMVVAKDLSWSTGLLGYEQSYVLNVESGMKLSFVDSALNSVTGEISFVDVKSMLVPKTSGHTNR